MILADALDRQYPHKSEKGRLLRERVQEACDTILVHASGVSRLFFKYRA